MIGATKIKILKEENAKLRQLLNEVERDYDKRLTEAITTANNFENILKVVLKKYNELANKDLKNLFAPAVNVDLFVTNNYKQEFENFVNNEGHTDIEILIKFNELYNEESTYFDGIVTCIDFIRTKRNPKLSTEKQILKYILTETGRKSLDSYIEAIATGNTGEK